MAVLQAEIAKCDVVCALCHRFRTARRAGWKPGANWSDELLDVTQDT